MRKNSFSLEKSVFKLIVLIIIAILLNWLKHYPFLIENLYTNGFYLYWSTLLRFVFGQIPFAIGDLFYAIFIIFLIYSFFKSIKSIIKSRNKGAEGIKRGLKFINFTLLFYLIFQLSWGINYARPNFNSTLNLSADYYEKADLINLAKLLIDKMNKIDYSKVKSLRINDHSTLIKNAQSDFQKLKLNNPQTKYLFPSVKPSLSSMTLSKLGLEGYYNPFTGEANVNRLLPAVTLPFTYAHEIAHQMSFAREDEASFMAYIAGIKSNNLSSKYSAYFAALNYVLFELYKIDPKQFQEVYNLTPQNFKSDFNEERTFWKQHRSFLFDYMSSMIDSFLKVNQQETGILSYREVVIWIYNYHKNELPAKR